MHPPSVIQGDRVRLRRSTPADAEAVFACASDAEVMRYMEWPAHKECSQAKAFLEGCAQRWEEGVEYHWMIEPAKSGMPHGCIACRVRGHAADFGYFLRRSSWGRGIAGEAASLVVNWLKEQPGVLRIWASADAENCRSIALLERLGLRREGILRMATYRPNIGGLPRDTVVLGLCDGP